MTPIEELILRRFELLEHQTRYSKQLLDNLNSNSTSTSYVWGTEYLLELEDIVRIEQRLKDRIKELEEELDYERWSKV